MKPIIFIVLILCALNLYVLKCVCHAHREKSYKEGIKMAARQALRYILVGMVALGLFLVLLSQFSSVRRIGYTFISREKAQRIKDVLEVVFGKRSVRKIVRMFIDIAILAVELNLILSFFGFILAEAFVFVQMLQCTRVGVKKDENHSQEVEIPYAERKIFLSYANLRI